MLSESTRGTILISAAVTQHVLACMCRFVQMHNPIAPPGLRHISMPSSGMLARGRMLVRPELSQKLANFSEIAVQFNKLHLHFWTIGFSFLGCLISLHVVVARCGCSDDRNALIRVCCFAGKHHKARARSWQGQQDFAPVLFWAASRRSVVLVSDLYFHENGTCQT